MQKLYAKEKQFRCARVFVRMWQQTQTSNERMDTHTHAVAVAVFAVFLHFTLCARWMLKWSSPTTVSPNIYSILYQIDGTGTVRMCVRTQPKS